VLPTGNVEPEAGVHVTVGVLTISVAVGAVYVTVIPDEVGAAIAISLCGAIMGAVVSCTITSKNDEAELPAVSLAVHVILVSPNGYIEPESWSHVIVGVLTVSVAVGAVYVTVAPAELVASAVMSIFVVIVGTVVSWTNTSKDDEAELPAASVAVHITLV